MIIFVVPIVILLVGLALGGGLYYGSHRMRGRLKCVEDARPCKAGNPGTGLVKLHGTVKAVNPAEVLTSPIEQRPCVYYKMVIEHLKSGGISSGKSSVQNMGTWVPVVEDVQAIPMVVADETGEVGVDPHGALFDFKPYRLHANMFVGLDKQLERSLVERYDLKTKTWFIPKQLRYTEVVVPQDAEVFAAGECHVHNGKATLTGGKEPLLVTFRNEKQVVRNGKITATICLVLAAVFPIVFTTIAILAFTTMWKDFGGNAQAAPGQNAGKPQGAAGQNAAKPDRKKDPTEEAIAKLQDDKANLSARAWAARKLAETPVQKDQVAEVAPHLNPLLESKDTFHRDSAVLAIKQGWGSTANGDALRRALQSTKDTRAKKELSAALNRIGS